MREYLPRKVRIILIVDAELVNRLLTLNREFYARFGSDFSETRSSARLNLNPLAAYLADGIKLLDLGCGNGRLAQALDIAGYHIAYMGLDSSPALVEIAKSRGAKLKNVRATVREADLAAPDWIDAVAEDAPFDIVVALAVLHHLPGYELRRAVLDNIRLILKPDGVLVMSNWQFMHNERLRKKIVPWENIGVDARGLEEGDALLDWKRGGLGYRYCHQLTIAEVEALAQASGFEVQEQFVTDSGLNLYSFLRRN